MQFGGAVELLDVGRGDLGAGKLLDEGHGLPIEK